MTDVRTYTVQGMHCDHCTSSVSEEVQEIPGVDDVQVVLASGALTVTSREPLDDAAVRAAVEAAGYQVA